MKWDTEMSKTFVIDHLFNSLEPHVSFIISDNCFSSILNLFTSSVP